MVTLRLCQATPAKKSTKNSSSAADDGGDDDGGAGDDGEVIVHLLPTDLLTDPYYHYSVTCDVFSQSTYIRKKFYLTENYFISFLILFAN